MIHFTRKFNKETKEIGFKVFSEDNKFYCEDMYGNIIYIAKSNKQFKVMDLFISDKLNNTFHIDDIDNIVREHFNRKIYK